VDDELLDVRPAQGFQGTQQLLALVDRAQECDGVRGVFLPSWAGGEVGGCLVHERQLTLDKVAAGGQGDLEMLQVLLLRDIERCPPYVPIKGVPVIAVFVHTQVVMV
jgi:hypothetical protein